MRFLFAIPFMYLFFGSSGVIMDHTQVSVKADTVISQHSKIRRISSKEFDPFKRYPAFDCVFTNKLTFKQRLKKYPFSGANKIVVVSYRSAGEKNGESLNERLNKNLHITDGILNNSSIIELKILSAKQTSELTNIIYNTDYRNHHQKPVVSSFNCFDPRNAILFYNGDGKIYDYLEICFECHRISSLSDNITIGTDCNQKLDLMRNFLISAGIKYGTTRTD